MTTERKQQIERIYNEWDKALSDNDAEALLQLYAKDAILESPVIPALTGNEKGELQGHAALLPLFKTVAERKPEVRKYYRKGYFTDGHQLVFEYPHHTPNGEQMDFVEVMEINEEGLIQKHKVYWGWYGVNVIEKNRYHR
jgi:hypothetical protein